MAKPVLHVCDIPCGIHEVHPDRVTQDMHVARLSGICAAVAYSRKSR